MEPTPDNSAPTITDAEFAQFQALLRGITGIHLSEFKKTLLVARLASRLRARKARTFSEYYKIIKHPLETEELQLAINYLTTNETFFFREPEHFQILKDFIASLRPVPLPFRVWSAASSSGEEAYSIAMVLADVLGGAKWEVVGSDISTRVLDRARAGLYPLERNGGIPKDYLHRYCLKGQGAQEGMMLIGKQLRERVHFTQVNLNEPIPDRFLELLQQLGCDHCQGFYFSAALPAQEFVRMISIQTHPSQDPEIDPAATQSRLALG